MLSECKKKVSFLRLTLASSNSKALAIPGCNCTAEVLARTDLDGVSSPAGPFGGIVNKAAETVGGVDSSSVRIYALPNGSGGFLIDVTTAFAGFSGSLQGDLYINDFALHRTGAGWTCYWSSITLYVNGALVSTYTATLSYTSALATPAGVPFLGVPAYVSGDAAPMAIPPFGLLGGGLVLSPLTPGSSTSSATVSWTGGWSWKEYGGLEVGIPVSSLFSEVAGGCGDCVVGTYPSVGGDHTNNLTGSAGTTVTTSITALANQNCCLCADGQMANPCAVYNVWLKAADVQQWNSGQGGEPNVPRSFKRYSHQMPGMPDDYGAAVRCSGLPQTTLVNTSVCHDLATDVITDSSTTTVVHARTAKSAAHLRSGAHSIEAPLALATPNQLGWNSVHYHATANYWKLASPGACPASGEGGGGAPPACITLINEGCTGTVGQQFPGVDDSSAEPDLTDAPGLYHPDPICRYENYRVSPHWAYRPFFPKSSDTGANAWLVGGVPADPVTAWLLWRQQQAKDPRMSGGDASTARMDLISPTLLASPLQGFWKGFYADGQYTSPLGTDSHKAVQFSVPASVTLTSSETAGWTFGGCAGAFNATLDLTPAAAGTVTATYDLGEFGTDPRMLPLLLRQVVAGWAGGAITSAEISLVGVDGSSAILGTAPGTYGYPSSKPATKYALSCEQDYTAGFATSDTGAAAGPGMASDISVTELADPEHNMAFELLPGWAAAKLVFTFVVTGVAVINLTYPTFNLVSSPKVVPENPYTDIVIYDSGPALRLGSHQWETGLPGSFAWQSPPGLYPYGIGRNAVDGLADGYCLFLGEDPTAVGHVLAQVNVLYDTLEQGGLKDAALGTWCWWVPAGGKPCLAIANGYETPPIGTVPRQARDANLAETGVYAGEAWTHAQESRRYVTAGSTSSDVFDGSGVQWTTPDFFSVAGFAISSHDHATTGSEGDAYEVKVGGVEIATLSPYHGSYIVRGTPTATPLSYDVSLAHRHAIAYLDSTSAHLKIATAGNEPQPLVWSAVDTGISTVTSAKVRWQRYGGADTLGVFYRDSSGLHWMQTHDDGGSFTSPMTITSGGTYWAQTMIDSPRGVKWFYWLESSGTVYMAELDAQLNVITARTATNLTGLDNAPIEARESIRDGGEFRIGVVFSASGSVQFEMASADGLTFS